MNLGKMSQLVTSRGLSVKELGMSSGLLKLFFVV